MAVLCYLPSNNNSQLKRWQLLALPQKKNLLQRTEAVASLFHMGKRKAKRSHRQLDLLEIIGIIQLWSIKPITPATYLYKWILRHRQWPHSPMRSSKIPQYTWCRTTLTCRQTSKRHKTCLIRSLSPRQERARSAPSHAYSLRSSCSLSWSSKLQHPRPAQLALCLR